MVDDIFKDFVSDGEYVTLADLCSQLSISVATGKNWLKLGKISPSTTQNNKRKNPLFTREYVNSLKNDILQGENQALKSRRNKKFVSGNSLYSSYVSSECKNVELLQKILNIAEQEEITFNDAITNYVVVDCALHLFIKKNKYKIEDVSSSHQQKNMVLGSNQVNENSQVTDFCQATIITDAIKTNQTSLLEKFLNKEFSVGEYDCLILALIDNKSSALKFCKQYSNIFAIDYVYEPLEDVLGLIYISCRNIGNRKATGSYYTPTKVVKKLIDKLTFSEKDKVLDPCCGTGNFLLQLPSNVPFANIFGNDLDSNSVRITRLNMALKYDQTPVSEILSHITELNYLTNYKKNDFQYVIGNPPWGYSFSDSEKKELKQLYRATTGTNIESFVVVIEKALNSLAKNGQLSFVVPESILNVKAHLEIRRIILERCSIRNLEFLGNAFDGVQCPSIILQLVHTDKTLSTKGMIVKTTTREFTIDTNRRITEENFSFLANDVEYSILEKLKSVEGALYLENNADFALGIVTGNNKEYISYTKTADNEMVLKGSDITKYNIHDSHEYIVFKPERFQQIAPTYLYRAPEKLLYRFISKRFVFAYDDKQTLSLNSCNIVIPKLEHEGIKIKYVLAILNSSIAQYIYSIEHNSLKVLRAHIESIPIPKASEKEQNKIIALVDKIMDLAEEDQAEIYEELDLQIFKLFDLNKEEQDIVMKAIT